MAFKQGQKRGSLWEDAQIIAKIISEHGFNRTDKDEDEFENSFSTVLDFNQKNMTHKVYTQKNRSTTVNSVYCFGKNNRPDMAIDEDGIAIELKYIDSDLDRFRNAIGQSIVYRLAYRFVILLLVVSDKNKQLYSDICTGKESDMDKVLTHLADELNVFTFIVPAFKIKGNQKKLVSYFK